MAYLGKEIHRACDHEGSVLVLERGLRRTLSFNGADEQSAMSLANPVRLEYVYTQAMMLGALLVAEVRQVLLLGLGGGSLARALLYHFPECVVTAVESRQLVVDVARRFFALPSGARLKIHVADAGRFLESALDDRFDLIFTDLYGSSGMDPQQTEGLFLSHCRAALRDSGALVINLWNTDFRASRRHRSVLVRTFEGVLLQMAVQGGNSIAFGFARNLPKVEPRPLFDRAQELGHRMGIPLQRFARGLWSQNFVTLQAGRMAIDSANPF